MAELMRNQVRLDPHLCGGVAQRLTQRREQHVAAFGPRQKELRIGRRWQSAEGGERSEERRVGKAGRSRTSSGRQTEDGIRDAYVTGVQTCALPICSSSTSRPLDRAKRNCGSAAGGSVRRKV